MSKITVEEFCELIKKDIDLFGASYRLGQKEDDEGNYPEKLDEADWYEQLVMYLQL